MSINGDAESGKDFLPWNDQDSQLIGGDIVPSPLGNPSNTDLRWPNARIPYVISPYNISNKKFS